MPGENKGFPLKTSAGILRLPVVAPALLKLTLAQSNDSFPVASAAELRKEKPLSPGR